MANKFKIKRELISDYYQFGNYITNEKDSFIIEQFKRLTLPGRISLNRQLFLIGNTGVGKTHLVQAFCNYITKQKTDFYPYYTTSNNISMNFVAAIRRNEKDTFLSEIENFSSLVIDDIDNLAGKEKTQEVILNLLNKFLSTNKPVVVTSSKPLNHLKGFDNRLLSHLMGGTTVRLNKPDYKTRIKYINQKVYKMEINIGLDLLGIIAHLSKSSDIRLINGILESLKFLQNQTKQKIQYHQLINVLNLYMR